MQVAGAALDRGQLFLWRKACSCKSCTWQVRGCLEEQRERRSHGCRPRARSFGNLFFKRNYLLPLLSVLRGCPISGGARDLEQRDLHIQDFSLHLVLSVADLVLSVAGEAAPLKLFALNHCIRKELSRRNNDLISAAQGCLEASLGREASPYGTILERFHTVSAVVTEVFLLTGRFRVFAFHGRRAWGESSKAAFPVWVLKPHSCRNCCICNPEA